MRGLVSLIVGILIIKALRRVHLIGEDKLAQY